MYRFIRQISDWGVSPDHSADQIRRIRLTNVILLLLVFASILQTAICFLTGATEAGILNSAAPFVFGAGLLLMKSGHTILARFFVLTTTYVAGYALCAAMGPESYVQLMFVFFAAFAVVFLSIDEAWLLGYGLVMPFICFVLLEVTQYEPVFGMQRAELGPQETFVSRVTSIFILWSIMSANFIYFLRDRRNSQAQLVGTAKMLATARMAAGIAHEVNNPLQIIVSQAEKLKKLATMPAGGQEKISGAAERIQSVAMRIATINKGLLALSRDATSDPLIQVPVRRILGMALDFCGAHFESQKVDLRLSDFPKHWTVIGRETQLSQVILNILANAYDAVAEVERKWIKIEVMAESEFIEISVIDSGGGVNVKNHGRIFEPFFTTKPLGKGTGLGLSLSQGIIQDHQGRMSFDPSYENTRFVIRLPRGPDEDSRS